MTDPETPLLLYVEDEVLIRVAVIDGLEEAGYSVVVANSGAQAMSLLAKHKAELRGLVTDIILVPVSVVGRSHGRHARPSAAYPLFM